MKKIITSLICFICLLTFNQITCAAPIDIGKHIQKKDVVIFVQDTTFQASQVSMFNLDIPTDVGKIYSLNYNINKTTLEFAENTFSLVNADFKVGWKSKGSLLINYM